MTVTVIVNCKIEFSILNFVKFCETFLKRPLREILDHEWRKILKSYAKTERNKFLKLYYQFQFNDVL